MRFKGIILLIISLILMVVFSYTVFADEKSVVGEDQNISGNEMIGEGNEDEGEDSSSSSSIDVESEELVNTEAKQRDKTEILAKRTKYSKHFLNEDGSLSSVLYQVPVHYKKGEEWIEIDPRIIHLEQLKDQTEIGELNYGQLKKAGFSHGMVKNKFNLYFSQNSNKPQRFVIGASWLSSQPIGGHGIKGEFGDNEVIYPGVWQNTDLKYISNVFGLKEEIILQSPEHPTEFSFKINLHGFSYEQQDDGSILLKDEVGDVQAIIPKAFMEDANDEYSDQIEMRIDEKGEGKQLVLTMIPDKEWLNSEERAYPVVIDPSYYIRYDKAQDAYATSYGDDDTKRGTKERLELGMNRSGFYYYSSNSYLQFSLLGIPEYANLIEAYARLYLYNDYENDGNAKVRIYKLAESWNEGTLTWRNKPEVTGTYIPKTVIEEENHYVNFSLSESWVKDWLIGSNYGFAIITPWDDSCQTLDYYYSSEKGDIYISPKLYVDYNAIIEPQALSTEDNNFANGYFKDPTEYTWTYSDINFNPSGWKSKIVITDSNNSIVYDEEHDFSNNSV
ncbi:MAG: DNRLRE domain-containing protein, partial [Halanaerobiales bacterium]|nr:DNRLRE domain-containing protein [Halanaerobiales bacterium]